MKKIRRTRIRTRTSKLVFLEERSAQSTDSLGGHEFCPACGQPLPAPVKNITALPVACPELHADRDAQENVLDLKKQEE